MNEFYSISRNCLVKDVKYYDDFDLIFAEVFKGQIGEDNEMKPLLEEWLKKAIEREIPEEQKNALTRQARIAQNIYIMEAMPMVAR